MEVTTRPLTREQLSAFLPDHRSIVAFETVQKDIGAQGDVLSTAPFVTTEANTNLGSARILTGDADVTVTDDAIDHKVTLGLTDTGVTPDTYGTPTRILVLAIDAKGRITNAEEIKLNVSDVDGVLAVAHGGTGQGAFAVGTVVYAASTTELLGLATVASGNVLHSGGVGTAPLWGKVDLTADVSGVLPAANGGFPGGGFTGTVSPVVSITVSNGLVTAVS